MSILGKCCLKAVTLMVQAMVNQMKNRKSKLNILYILGMRFGNLKW